MKILSRDIASLFEKPNSKFFAYLLHGMDAGLIDERAKELALLFSDNLNDPFSVTRLTGKEVQVDPALLADALNALTLLGTMRVVLLSGTATELMSAIKSNIEYLHAECRLIVSAKDSTTKHSLVTLCDKHPNVASVACYPDEDEQRKKLIYETLIQNNIDISSHLTEYISNKLGDDRSINRNEIEKISLYAAKTKSINKEEIDLVLGDNNLPILDKLVDNVFKGKTETIGPLLTKIRAEGIQPVVIIRYFQSHVKILITIGAKKQKGLSIQAAVNNIRPPIYFKRKQSVINHSKLFSIKGCSALMERFMLLEGQCKMGSNPNPYSLIGQSLLGVAIKLSNHRV